MCWSLIVSGAPIVDLPQAANKPEDYPKRLRLTVEENATLGAVALILGLASAYAQFLGSEVHGWLLLIAVCILLTALTVGVVVLVKRVRTISLPWALLIVAFAAAGGGGTGYLIRDSNGPAQADKTAPSTPAGTSGKPASPADSGTMTPSAGEAAAGTSGWPGEATSKGPAVNTTALDSAGSRLGGKFENVTTRTTGCLAGLSFMIDEGLPPGKRIWVMVYKSSDKTTVYPERKLDFANSRGSAAPFPIGSEADPEGTEFEVLGVLLDSATSNRYEKEAELSGTLPIERVGPPGRVLDQFSVSRDKAYTACT
jgi:hypothetical protein